MAKFSHPDKKKRWIFFNQSFLYISVIEPNARDIRNPREMAERYLREMVEKSWRHPWEILKKS